VLLYVLSISTASGDYPNNCILGSLARSPPSRSVIAGLWIEVGEMVDLPLVAFIGRRAAGFAWNPQGTSTAPRLQVLRNYYGKATCQFGNTAPNGGLE